MMENNQLSRLKQQFEAYLEHCLDTLINSTIKDAMLYSLLGGGKRLRPMLLLATLQDLEEDPSLAMPIAAAIEMIHTYSLIHDDLPAMDDDVLRRGKPTNHIQFDEATAILAGDALLTQAFAMIMESTYDASTKGSIVLELAQASGANGMILGQHYDIISENKTDIDEASIIQIDGLKTGKLIALPLRLAAIIANHSSDLQRMDELGHELGITFQIQDDILNITSTKEVLGKSIGSDALQGKTTYVSLLGLEGASSQARQRFQRVVARAKQGTKEMTCLCLLLDTLLYRQH